MSINTINGNDQILLELAEAVKENIYIKVSNSNAVSYSLLPGATFTESSSYSQNVPLNNETNNSSGYLIYTGNLYTTSLLYASNIEFQITLNSTMIYSYIIDPSLFENKIYNFSIAVKLENLVQLGNNTLNIYAGPNGTGPFTYYLEDCFIQCVTIFD
jgi:hypothetical protein